MSLIITFMFEPAKLQMNWASASGARNLRRDDDRACRCGIRAHRAARFAAAPAARTSRATTIGERWLNPREKSATSRPPPHVVLLGESAGDPEERLGGDGHHPDDLANAVKLEALARHRPRHGPDWTARMLAKLECVSHHLPA